MLEHDTDTRELVERGRLERVALTSVRIGLGVMWLVNVGWKTPPDFGESSGSGLIRYTRAAVDHPVFAPYAWVVRELVLPNFRLFGWAVLIVEASLGAFLLLGWKTRLWAVVGIAQSAAIGLSVLHLRGEWPWSYYLMVLAHLAVFATAAPPAGGLDRALLSVAGRQRAGGALAAVSIVAGIAGLITVWIDGGQTNLGWGRGELSLMGVNVSGSVLMIAIGAIGGAALLSSRPMLYGVAAVLAGAGVIITAALWRNGETNFLGADGGTLSFELMLAVGFGLLSPAVPSKLNAIP